MAVAALLCLASVASFSGAAEHCSFATASARGSWRLAGARAAGGKRCASRSQLPRRAGEGADKGVRMRVEDLTAGQELNGLVLSTASFGCFVDIGADRDGFVHISRMADTFVDDAANFVYPGQSVKVWVKGVDEEGKLDLSMVKSKAQPGGDAADLSGFVDVPPEQWLEGTVAGITDFGLFVVVAPPAGGPSFRGMVHISQIREGFVEHPADEVEVGQAVQVRVTDVDPETGKMRLSMKPYAGPKAYTRPDDQDVTGLADVSPSTWFKARVHHTAPFGIFAELEPPAGGEKVMGLVHVTEMREGFVADPSAEVEVDQEVNVRVLRVDQTSGRITLSMKPEAEEVA